MNATFIVSTTAVRESQERRFKPRQKQGKHGLSGKIGSPGRSFGINRTEKKSLLEALQCKGLRFGFPRSITAIGVSVVVAAVYLKVNASVVLPSSSGAGICQFARKVHVRLVGAFDKRNWPFVVAHDVADGVPLHELVESGNLPRFPP